jgi:hypothetical protein
MALSLKCQGGPIFGPLFSVFFLVSLTFWGVKSKPKKILKSLNEKFEVQSNCPISQTLTNMVLT